MDPELYVATLKSASGFSSSCSSTGDQCVVSDVVCGEMYTASVLALGSDCQSFYTDELIIDPAPCIPDSIEVQLGCGTDTVSMSWNDTVGAQSYIALVIGEDGQYYSCNTTDTACSMSGLQCGYSYSASITAITTSCSSTSVDVTEFHTAPCIPNNVAALLDCGTNTATLSWGGAAGAVSYTSTVTGPDGEQRSCNATDTTCNVTDLQCGQTYTSSVIALGDQCSSAPSGTTDLQTAPCAPQNLAMQFDCDNNIAVLSWDTATGAANYVSTVTGPQGEQYLCNTTATSCNIGGLACGQTYNATVTAFNEACSNATSALTEFQTAPCVPQNVGLKLDCGTNTATLSWDGAPGAVSYTSTVTGPDGELRSCNATGTTCDVTDLQCGQTYAATVTAFDDQCGSAPSAAIEWQSAPCIVKSVSAVVECATNVAAVSWDSAVGAESYTSTVTAPDGEQGSCNATGTTCEIQDLQCGQTYAVSVTAFNEQCSAPDSALSEFQTGEV
ncbi:fibronectin type III domain-containing protein 7-like [Rhinatrema bivittatum]|uniref:fibronectin type III domain-containing protein 7-like n=1 Tax=Rhinatrema bivittatum TaxID=194408 RepID=UPI001128FF92|nr:fibronectin type III domain-containing protein 7-like [Rhinatrema bivittatum]